MEINFPEQKQGDGRPWAEGSVEFQKQEIKKSFHLDHTIEKIKNAKEKILVASREEYKKITIKDKESD